MPVAQCPKCESEYESGGKNLDNLPDGMSIKVVCPVCGQWLRLPENDLIPTPEVPPDILQAMMKQSRLIKRGKGSSAGKPWWKFW